MHLLCAIFNFHSQGENFVSDIGGQLGLWAGFSVLSLAEVLELVIILFHACFSRKMTEVMDFEKD